MEDGAMRQLVPRFATAVALVAVAIGDYVFLGPGPSPSERSMDLPWWRPLGLAWSLEWGILAPLQDISAEYEEARHFGRWEWQGLIPIGIFALPVILLSALGFRAFRSALARVLVIAFGLTTFTFVYYGWLDPGTWEDYGWRWPIALLVTSVYVSAFALAPALVEALRSRSRALQVCAFLACFVPIYFLTIEVTGTNPELEWNLSPWPVITLYGFLLVGLVFGVIHLAAGLGLAIGSGSRFPGWRGVALAAVAAGLLAAGLRSIPFAVTDLVRMAVLSVPAAALAGIAASRSKGSARQRAITLIAAGIAILACIKPSQWQAEFFQAEARDEIAPRLIAALDAHYADRETYPLELSELVPDYLSEIPSPRVGWLGDEGEAFMYIDLGDSYHLEFATAMWVQCHYSPPYSDEEEAEQLEASWSCEPQPPRLW